MRGNKIAHVNTLIFDESFEDNAGKHGMQMYGSSHQYIALDNGKMVLSVQTQKNDTIIWSEARFVDRIGWILGGRDFGPAKINDEWRFITLTMPSVPEWLNGRQQWAMRWIEDDKTCRMGADLHRYATVHLWNESLSPTEIAQVAAALPVLIPDINYLAKWMA